MNAPRIHLQNPAMLSRYTLLLLTVVMLAAMAWPPPGKLAGHIRDAETGADLAGAEVTLRDTDFAARTDSLGRFYVLGVPEGTYTVDVQHEGYEDAHLDDVAISAAYTRSVEFELAPRE